MVDYTLASQQALIKGLKANAAYVDLIPKASVFDETVPDRPTWPFSRIASVVVTPFRATGLNASAMRINVQAFTKDVTDSIGTVQLPAAINARVIAAAMVDALDGRTLPIAGGMNLRLTWVQNFVSIDGDEQGAWKCSCIFTGEVAG